MKKVVYWITPTIAVGVIFFIIYLFIDINSTGDLNVKEVVLSPQEVKLKEKIAAPWLQRLSNSERQGYFYPVNEIFIEMGLEAAIKKEWVFRLSASIKDPFQLFCLRQELKNFGLIYSLNKEKKETELLIYSKDKRKLNTFVDTLKNYKIVASVKPYEMTVPPDRSMK